MTTNGLVSKKEVIKEGTGVLGCIIQLGQSSPSTRNIYLDKDW